MFAHDTSASLVVALALGLASGCVRQSSVADLRGVGRGWQLELEPRLPPALDAGRNVRVLDSAAAAACRPIGYVSGSVVRYGIRLADMDHAQLAASLDRGGAIIDARNLAGAHHGDAIVIDADETVESGRAVALLVHGRVLRCAR